MEKDNKKIRDEAKKKRNELVRRLVSYVRKRDRRVQEYRKLLEEKEIERKRKIEEKKILDARKRISDMKQNEYKLCEEETHQFEQQMNVMEAQIDSEFGRDDSSDESESVDVYDLYCAACNKMFKSDKSFANHEKSKKHKDSVLLLKQTLEMNYDIIDTKDDSDIVDNSLILGGDNSTCNELTTIINDTPQGTNCIDNDINSTEEYLKTERTPSPPNIPDINGLTIQEDNVEDSTHKNLAYGDQDVADNHRKEKKSTKKQKSKQEPKQLHEMSCAVCDVGFTSRNKLFEHIRAEGHGVGGGHQNGGNKKRTKKNKNK
jgi:DnaJ family protein A protein 5